jgi:hypothetical protein
MKFGNWNETLHNDCEQIKRIVSSQRIKSEKVTIDPITQSAEIVGRDGTYSVTLNSCTCFDFEFRQLPCKHMYCLSRELGYLTDLPVVDRKAAKSFKDNLPDEIERYKQLYFDGAISGEKFSKIVNALTSK